MSLVRAMQIARSGVRYRGWTMVFVSSVCLALVFASSTATMPLLYGPAMDEFGWSRTQATLVFTFKNAASAIAALFVLGPLCHRFGLRTVAVGAHIFTGAGMLVFLLVESLWTYYLAGAALGVGIAAVFVSAKVLVSRWFVKNQGLAIGVMLAGASLGSAMFPMIYTYLEAALGWRAAFAALSLGIWGVALPLYLAKAREQPSDADLSPELDAATGRIEPAPNARSLSDAYAEVLRGRGFWLIVVSLFLVAAADAGLMQHTALFLERDAGLSAAAAAAAISGTLGLGVIAKAAAGWCYDRLSLLAMSLWYVLLAVSLLLAFTVTGGLTLLLFAGVRGIAHGGLMSEPAIIAKHCFGAKLMDLTVPVLLGVWATGAAVGPMLLAVIYDAQGTYSNGFMLLVSFCLVAAVTLYLVPSASAPREEPGRAALTGVPKA